jgi:hypothetical protein
MREITLEETNKVNGGGVFLLALVPYAKGVAAGIAAGGITWGVFLGVRND